MVSPDSLATLLWAEDSPTLLTAFREASRVQGPIEVRARVRRPQLRGRPPLPPTGFTSAQSEERPIPMVPLGRSQTSESRSTCPGLSASRHRIAAHSVSCGRHFDSGGRCVKNRSELHLS
ncbi:hypothetical protein NDU88_005593 [Pleurodeles waltl]|uniref:Uncharacterized protein n=1 Tax=Pleurodeles waltl TaxID=8319 RepID=A0AAV7MCK0_PLEWA|nr:hypothetical protein NDU88_005593 [Pleurodeles waltl]